MITDFILGISVLLIASAAFYWYHQFRKAQSAAESLYWLATNACTSYDNDVWHSGICEGEVLAGNAIEDARQTLSKLPSADKDLVGGFQDDDLPF